MRWIAPFIHIMCGNVSKLHPKSLWSHAMQIAMSDSWSITKLLLSKKHDNIITWRNQNEEAIKRDIGDIYALFDVSK